VPYQQLRIRGFLFLGLSLIAQLCSTYFGKMAALSISWGSPASVLLNRYYLLSLLCLGFQALFWPFALRDFSLLTAYTAMTLVYPGVLAISALCFHETLNVVNFIGAAIIMAGVAIFASDAKGSKP
jgi:hypothetical protein